MMGELIMQWSQVRNKPTSFRMHLLSHKLSRQICINWGSNPEDFIAYPVSCLTGVSEILLRKSQKEVFRHWFWDRHCKPE